MEKQEKNLKKTLTRSDLIGLAIGQIIGAGVMSLCGVAIGMTGTGVVFSFLLAAAISSVSLLPATQITAACPTTGGTYRYPSRLLGPRIGFVQIMIFILMQMSISMYALTFATYFQDLVPGVNLKLVACILLTIVFLTNLVGTKTAAMFQKIMVIALFVGLASFILFGITEVNYDYVFDLSNMFPNGSRQFFTAAALLTFSTGGALSIAELGGEVKNPKDLPIAMIGSTIFVGAIYALLALVASGILPWKEVANQSLTKVAMSILPKPLFFVFMLGGALGATATTLNATFTWVTKPVIIACDDGWFPSKLASVNKKYGTPHYLLLLFYLVGLVPILLNMSLGTIATMGTGVGCIFEALVPLSALFFVKKYPEAYKKSRFKLPVKLIPFLSIFSFVVLIIQSFLLLSDLTPLSMALSYGYIALSFVAATIIMKKKNIVIPDDLADNINKNEEIL